MPLTESPELPIIRRAFARQMAVAHGLVDPRIEAAFATVRREDFLADAPWSLLRLGDGPRTLDRNDPVQLYQDVLVVLDRERGVNNGSPSLHALMLQHLGVQPGDRVLHVGVGGGYYTAMLAELATPTGQVTAVEFDPRLAEQARGHLAPWPNVVVHTGDGAAYPAEEVDRVYINFAVTQPAEHWLDFLALGGTLEFPLAVRKAGEPNATSGEGAVLVVTRVADGFAAKFVSRCGFVCAEGPLSGAPQLTDGLRDAFQRGGIEFVASLRRGPSPPERCWFWSPGWSLSYDLP